MKVAVITPYWGETEQMLRRCHESVLAQTHPCTQIVIADGRPQDCVDRFSVQHIRLPKAHDDCGDTPRVVGSMSAISQGFDAITFLDGDNWFLPDHVATMVALQRRSGAAVCTATRDLYRLDGTYMATCRTSDGEQHADTNTMFLTSPAFHLIPRFLLIAREEHVIGDRIFWHAIKESGLPRAHEKRPTVCYLATHAGFYRDLKEPVPPDTKDGDAVRRALAAWKKRGLPSLALKSRYSGIQRPGVPKQPVAPAPAALPQLRIALVIHTFPPYTWGGVENSVLWLAQALVARGHRAMVFHTHYDPARPDYEMRSSRVEGVEVRRMNCDRKRGYPLFGDARLDEMFAQWLQDEQLQMVHFHHLCGHLSASMVHAAKRLAKPVVITAHDSWLFCAQGHAIHYLGKPCSGPDSTAKCAECFTKGSKDGERVKKAVIFIERRNAYLRRALVAADRVTAPSEYLRTLARQAAWLPKKPKIVLIPNGVDTLATGRAARDPGQRLRAGALGNFTLFQGIDLKGAGVLLQAFGKLQDRIELHVHGTVHAPWRAALQSKAGATLHGPYRSGDRAAIYAGLDIVVVPSMVESFSLVVREAFSAGIPVVAANTGGIPEAVRDGENGLLFEPGNGAALAAALRRLLDEPQLLERLRGGVQAPPAIAEMAAFWEQRYASLLPAGASASAGR